MELKVFPDYITMSVAAAGMILDHVRKNPNALLCFATGDTPKLTYELVVESAKTAKIDFSRCFLIGLDEWLMIPPDNSGSCHYFLQQYLIKPLGIASSQVHLFDGMTTNEQEECEKMNKIIIEKGGIEVMVVGVGMNGHIGFNEPGTAIDSLAHVSLLDETTRTVGKKYFKTEVSISKGITLGLAHVMEARSLLMIANGKKKAAIIKQALEKETSTDNPASLVRLHPNAVLVIDTEAASELETGTNDKSINQSI